MRSIRLAAVLAAGAVAAAGLFAGPASAASARPSGPPGLTWHPLILLNGWASAGAQYGTGDPAWAIKDGIVYLSGSLTQPGGTPASNPEVAMLPKAATPKVSIYTLAYTLEGDRGFVGVNTLGGLYAESNNSDAQQFTSLAGISYPAATATRTLLPLVGGWQGQLTTTGYESPAWTLTAGTVRLTGPLTSGTAPEFSVLPAFVRPAHTAYFPVVNAGAWGAVIVKPDGTMQATGPGALTWTELAAVNFTTASTPVTPLSLLNGWQSAQGQWGTGDPGYTVTGGIVHLSGSLTQPAAGTVEFATLPPNAWPSHYLYITTYAFDGAIGTVEITPDGAMYASSPDLTDSEKYTSLAGITFPAGS